VIWKGRSKCNGGTQTFYCIGLIFAPLIAISGPVESVTKNGPSWCGSFPAFSSAIGFSGFPPALGQCRYLNRN
jgi:hypothetical protein